MSGLFLYIFLYITGNVDFGETKTTRQLDEFTSKCHGNTCDYVVQISQNGNGNGTATVSLPRQILNEMKSFWTILRDVSAAVQSSMASSHTEVGALRENVTSLQRKFNKLQVTLNDSFVDVESKMTEQLHDLKAEVYRLQAMAEGKTQDGLAVVSKTTSADRQIASSVGVDCASLYKGGVRTSDIYILQPDPSDNKTRFDAYCDMDTAGGGWTVIQRRSDGSDDFFRNWKNYKDGFGNLYHDFWLGLDRIHLLTKFGNTKMRIDLQDWENNTSFSELSFVRVSDEADKYRIMAGAYKGNAGDPFHTYSYDLRMQSMQFSTFDNDNDMDPTGNCAHTFNSGWWFSKCFVVNLNGVWYPSGSYFGRVSNGIVWDLWTGHPRGYSLKKVDIKLRPDNF